MVKVNALICLICNTLVWSKYRHDFNRCDCGANAIDGGFDYIKVSGYPETHDYVVLELTPKEFVKGRISAPKGCSDI